MRGFSALEFGEEGRWERFLDLGSGGARVGVVEVCAVGGGEEEVEGIEVGKEGEGVVGGDGVDRVISSHRDRAGTLVPVVLGFAKDLAYAVGTCQYESEVACSQTFSRDGAVRWNCLNLHTLMA